MQKNYPVPGKERQVEHDVKKSRFIARAGHVTSREEAMAFVARARADYPDARHHCWAYLLGNPAGSCDAAMNDDGEPSGTAGKPMLNVIQHKRIGDVVLVVIRYFGGIKLGAGGLSRAYSAAAEAVLSGLELVHLEPMLRVSLRFDFSREQAVRHWATSHGAVPGEAEYHSHVDMSLRLPQRLVSELTAFCQASGIELAEVIDETDELARSVEER